MIEIKIPKKLQDLRKRIVEFFSGSKKSASKELFESSKSLHSMIVKATPVDTGRARGSWLLSERPDILFALKRVDRPYNSKDCSSGPVIYRQMGKVIAKEGKENYYISNPVPYIVTLEEGNYPGESICVNSNGFSRKAEFGIVKPILKRNRHLPFQRISQAQGILVQSF